MTTWKQLASDEKYGKDNDRLPPVNTFKTAELRHELESETTPKTKAPKMVKFSPANSKLSKMYNHPEIAAHLAGRKIYSFDLLSGWACPFASQCQSRAVEHDGKRRIKDGKHTEFRCFSASQEVLFKGVYNLRKRNYDALKALNDSKSMVSLIESALPKNAGLIRIHVAGDFFNRTYLTAWLIVAERHPDIRFYAYTKSLPYLENVRIPANLLLTASRGGSADHLIGELGIREAVVVYSENQATELDLPIDDDDSHAATRGGSFALLIHGVQPKGSTAATALQQLKK
jgi:hypothetical protein